MGEVHVKLGTLLRLEREQRKLTLAEISHDLKVSETNLQYIEEGNIEALPGPLFFGLFGKSYAELLGIDYTKTMEAIREDLGEPIEAANGGSLDGADRQSAGDSTRREPESDDVIQQKPASRFIIPVGALVLAILALAWYMLAPHAKLSWLQKVESVPSAKVQDSTAQAEALQEEKLPPAKLNLKLVARDRTWALVIADGDTALATNLKPWREYPVRAQERLVVSISSPLLVDVVLNGVPVDLSDPEKGTVAGVEISEANMEMFKRREPTDTVSPDSGLGDSTEGYTMDAVPPSDSVEHIDSAHVKIPVPLIRRAGAKQSHKADADSARAKRDSARGSHGI